MCLAAIGVVTEIRDDDGIPMALVAADPAAVGTEGGSVSACLLTCPDAAVGDTVIVHSGYVLEVLDPDPAPGEDP